MHTNKSNRENTSGHLGSSILKFIKITSTLSEICLRGGENLLSIILKLLNRTIHTNTAVSVNGVALNT